MRKVYLRYCLILICITLFGSFIWPGLYRYDKYDQKIPVRINRISGKTEFLFPDGWSVATSTPTPLPTVIATPKPTPQPTSSEPQLFNGETFDQFYSRVIKELNPGQETPSKNSLYFEWRRASMGLIDKVIEPKDYFTIGSSKDDVKKAMGLPTSTSKFEPYNEETWYYNSSNVVFKNGKVSDYNNSEKNLKMR